MGSGKKKQGSGGCLYSVFRLLLCIGVAALCIYLIMKNMSDKTKNDIRLVGAVIASLFILYCVLRLWYRLHRKYSLKKLDNMDGHQFEYACADILRANGFKKVSVTQGTRDFGVDILAEKRREKYAVQCKCYSKTLGNKPVQEVIGGLAYYGCTKGAVMTNQYFTDAAIKLAEVNDIELWDRDVLARMLRRTKKSKDMPDDEYEEALSDDDTEDEHIEATADDEDS